MAFPGNQLSRQDGQLAVVQPQADPRRVVRVPKGARSKPKDSIGLLHWLPTVVVAMAVLLAPPSDVPSPSWTSRRPTAVDSGPAGGAGSRAQRVDELSILVLRRGSTDFTDIELRPFDVVTQLDGAQHREGREEPSELMMSVRFRSGTSLIISYKTTCDAVTNETCR